MDYERVCVLELREVLTVQRLREGGNEIFR